MKNRLILLYFFCVALCNQLHGQSSPELSGYVSEMPSLITMEPTGDVWYQNLLHLRLNGGWQFAKHWRIDAGMRNRFIAGSESLIDPSDANADRGLIDMSWNWLENKEMLGNTSFDRLFLTFEKDQWKVQLGRQRINWGQTLVWNPNDIFNTYSFFDFDYPERAGCDALRITWFQSETSSSELAVSINAKQQTSVALLHHFNHQNFDYKIIIGETEETDFVAGGAWSGDFSGLNFRGEFSIFQPIKNFMETTPTVAIAIGLDYIFKNSLMLQTEVLYNNIGKSFVSNGLLGMYSAPLSAKTLSLSKWNLFAQASYPITPRLNGALSSMYFTDLKACYAGFSLDYSLAENLDASLITQYFATVGKSSPGDMQALLGFARLKYSF